MGRRKKIDPKRASKIRMRYLKDRASMDEIAEEEGVAKSTLFAFMADHNIEPRRSGPRKGRGGRDVLDEAAIRSITKALRVGTKSQAEIAREYGVTRQRIHQIKKTAKRKRTTK